MAKLERVYELHRFQLGILTASRERALSSGLAGGDYLEKIGMPGLNEPRKRGRDKEFFARQFADLARQLEASTIIGLVAAFEFEVFSLLKASIKAARSDLENAFKAEQPFNRYRRSLIEQLSEPYNLGAIYEISQRHVLPADDRHVKRLGEVIKHRNVLAHGNRFPPLSDPPDARETYDILRFELMRITGDAATASS